MKNRTEYRREYESRPDVKARRKMLRDTPERKEKAKLRQQKNRLIVNENNVRYYNRNSKWINLKRKTPQQREMRRTIEKRYRDNNPLKRLKSTTKTVKNIALELKINTKEYRYALQSWSYAVKQRDGIKCQVCGNDKNINAHHIFHKSLYPKLSLNLNNGIALCKEHHYEVHGAKLHG